MIINRYANEADSTVNVIYSTPACYLKAVNDAGLTYTTKQDDFFPYAIDAHSYWTGFYTSRPSIKYLERLGNHLQQASVFMCILKKLGIGKRFGCLKVS